MSFPDRGLDAVAVGIAAEFAQPQNRDQALKSCYASPMGAFRRAKTSTNLSILRLPTFLTSQPISNLNLSQSMHAAPNDCVTGWRIAGTREITTELCEFDEAA